jgi:hexokinase
MYLGELVRLILGKLNHAGLLFNGHASQKLLQGRWLFPTKYLSEIESDARGSYKNCEKVFTEFEMENVTNEDCANTRFVCECVSGRSAHLVSAGIATLINKIDATDVTVGIDGALYRKHPKYHQMLMKKIRQLVNPDISFELMLSEDGSGRGAALVAAVAFTNADN